MPAKTEEWEKCPEPAPEDILRWKEPIFAPPNRARGKPDKVGDQRVTATLISSGEFYELEVIEAIKIGGSGNVRVKAGDIIRRKPSTIALGDCYRKRQ